jgi:hypothetical protein
VKNVAVALTSWLPIVPARAKQWVKDHESVNCTVERHPFRPA